MSEKRIITIRSGNEEVRMEVTEKEYQRYFRPWWRQKKREQRNREAMEERGYTEESYEEWKENDMRDELFAEDTEELAEKRMLLGVLKDALDDLLPEEREIAEKVFGEEMSVYEYAEISGKYAVKVKELSERLDEMLKAQAEYSREYRVDGGWKAVVERFRNEQELTREMAEAFVDKVLAYEDGSVRVHLKYDKELKDLLCLGTEREAV